ncbi:MAG: heat-inducible transcriptional repressor HrcA [Spirochaetia bacterium]|nr:heat-inducible transcriptional repressor HrcA [Spirochaetia bacterium]
MTERQAEIIHTIVSEFVMTGEPVGSQVLVQKFGMNISSATVRKEMSILEQMGFLSRPHTSAGRLPTDDAFQLYINNLSEFYEDAASQKAEIDEIYRQAALQFDQLLKTTAHLLASTSNFAGYVLSPKAASSIINHIELVSVSDNLILLIMVSASNSVYQKKIRIEKRVTQEELYKISRYLNQRIKGYELSDIQEKELNFILDASSELQDLSDIAAVIVQSLVYNPPNQEVYLEGESNLFQKILETIPPKEKAEKVINKLADKDFVCELINQTKIKNGVCGKVGIEINGDHLAGVSILTKGYSLGGRDIGALGVIGMSRMPYEKIIPTIDYGAELLSKYLNQNMEYSFEDINEKIIRKKLIETKNKKRN